jgi:hypothetical protein
MILGRHPKVDSHIHPHVSPGRLTCIEFTCLRFVWSHLSRDTLVTAEVKSDDVSKVKLSLYTPWRRLGGEEV